MKVTKAMMGWLGGRARAKALSPERRREIARKANRARWANKTATQRRAQTAKARASSLKVRKAKAKKRKGAKKSAKGMAP
jgi:hypothetical protein